MLSSTPPTYLRLRNPFPLRRLWLPPQEGLHLLHLRTILVRRSDLTDSEEGTALEETAGVDTTAHLEAEAESEVVAAAVAVEEVPQTVEDTRSEMGLLEDHLLNLPQREVAVVAVVVVKDLADPEVEAAAVLRLPRLMTPDPADPASKKS